MKETKDMMEYELCTQLTSLQIGLIKEEDIICMLIQVPRWRNERRFIFLSKVKERPM
jgi:hypothetical protein